MKKNIKWLLSVALISCLFASGCFNTSGEHTHTYSSTYSYDKKTHWIAATCEHTDLKLNLSAHVGMSDGACNICGYDEHEGKGHTYASVLSHDEVNHWYAVTCGHDVPVKDKAAHVDHNNDKICDVQGCGYDYNHTHVYATEWSSDFEYHWYAPTCGCSVEGSNKQAHVDENKDGVCDVCVQYTYNPEEHEHDYATEWTKDETKHWHVADCEHTGVPVMDAAAHDGMSDGVCDVCGYDVALDGTHTHTYSAEWSKDYNAHWHIANCGHNAITDEKLAHVDADKNGVCDVCLGGTFDPAAHTHTYQTGEGEENFGRNTVSHWRDPTCEHTGIAVLGMENHVGMSDGVCDTCGWDVVEDEQHTHSYSSQWEKDENSHWHPSSCGHSALIDGQAAHSDGNEDGQCDVCGYGEHVHAQATTWSKDDTSHWYAATCGCTIEFSKSNHEGMTADGICDVCGYDVVVDGGHVHTYDTTWEKDYDAHWHNAACGHTALIDGKAAHVDENLDAVCDICGGPTVDPKEHTHTYQEGEGKANFGFDAENHWRNPTCEHEGIAVSGLEAHVGMDDDGVCDTCGYDVTVDGDHVHEVAKEYSSDWNGHWFAAICGHSAYDGEVEAHVGMGDGICDLCKYTDYDGSHVHTPSTVWSKDYNGHWHVATCHSDLKLDYAEHEDGNGDSKCDVCGQDSFDAFIRDIANGEMRAWVQSGSVTYRYQAKAADYVTNIPQQAIYSYEYGENYLHLLNDAGDAEYWYHNYKGELFAMADYGRGICKPSLIGDYGLAYVEGYHFDLGSTIGESFGVENMIVTLWEQGRKWLNFTIREDENGYGFSYNVLVAKGVDAYYIRKVNVSFTIGTYELQNGDGIITESHDYIATFSFSMEQYDATAAGDGTYYVADGASLLDYKYYDGEQMGGKPNATTPFQLEDYYVTSYDILYNGEVVDSDTVIQIERESNVSLPYQSVQSATGDFQYDPMTVTVVDKDGKTYTKFSMQNYGSTFFIGTSNVAVGTYTVTVKTEYTVKTFQVEVTPIQVHNLEVAIKLDGSKTAVTSYLAIVGEVITVASKVNYYADSTYAITVSDPSAITVVDNGGTASSNPMFGTESQVTFLKAGTYTITLTSLADPSKTAILTVTAKMPSTIAEELNGGRYVNNTIVNEAAPAESIYAEIYITFTPASEGASFGTATVKIILERADNVVIYENVAYAYNDRTHEVEMTYNGNAFTAAKITWENYKLNCQFDLLSGTYWQSGVLLEYTI